jgi:hypothetical protein
MKTEIFKTYTELRTFLPFASQMRRLRLAVLRYKILESTKNGFCYFTYEKPDGEIRETFITNDPEIRPHYEYKGGNSRARNEALLIRGWDTTASMWRTFRVDRIQKFWV